jgi:deoxyribonuclease IV
MREKNLLIGAHMSAAGGVHYALLEGEMVGATVIQLFTSNQRQWHAHNISEEEVALWDAAKIKTGITHIMSHDSYLINLGSPKKEMLTKSRKAFKEELERCHLLKIDYLTFHPGAAVGSSEQICLDTIVESLLNIAPLAYDGPTRLLIETTAGQGSNVGYKFEHLGYIIKKVHTHLKIGVCFDTCHSFTAGYDIRLPDGWEKTLNEFDNVIGLEYLFAFHLNDSLGDLGSRKDRHANLGKGKIGLKSFEYLMTNSKTKDLPKYLETPNGSKFWEDELKLLRKFGKK